MANDNPLILIVDDHLKNIQVLGSLLSGKNFDIGVAMNGGEALDFVTSNRPDLILLDIMMPEISGFEVCKKLKANPETRDIPVIFLTAKTEPEDIVKGFEIGAVDYITKPFNGAELLSRVSTQLENKRNRELILQKNNEQKELLHILCHDLYNPFAAIQSALEIIRDDPDALNTIVEVIDTSSSNGLEIIDLVRQMRFLIDKDSPLVLGTVHLKGALDEALTLLSRRLADKKIEVKCSVADDLLVVAEAVSLKNSVINNIITNALKFSYPGGTIRIEARKSGAMIDLLIADQGIGIPPNLLKDLFDIHKTTSRQGTAKELGTGFGMPLVKKFMEVYGGEIQVESTESRSDHPLSGTLVTLRLKNATSS